MYPQNIRIAIQILRGFGCSYSKIVKAIRKEYRYTVSKSGVKYVCDKQVESKGTDQQEIREKNGRPRLITEDIKKLWKRALSANPEITAKDIFRSNKHNPINASYSTVCRALNDMKLGAHIKSRSFFVGNEKGQQARLVWARRMSKFLKKDPSFFDKVLWSDESKLCASR